MQRIVILGGGESGIGSAVLAKIKGFDVFLSDSGKINDDGKNLLKQYEIEFEEGGHTLEKILNANEIIKSPGIPETVPIILAIKDKEIKIISEIEFAGRYDSARKICITGSNGKTTTTSLIYFMLKNAGINVGLAGNIGQSYAYQVATEKFDYYVIELSSFQLDGMYDFKADIAILMNITPDHLDRYDFKMQNYINSKFRITRNMKDEDCFIFCADDPVTKDELEKIVIKATMLPFSQEKEVTHGAYLKEEQIYVKYGDDEDTIYLKELSLAGKHNIYNSMAAAIAAKAIKIDKKIIRESLMNFQGVEHRMEKVLKIKNVLYINDSKATNVNSSWYALDS
ncbi:MAG: UDP-N-acetylmuramoyl-L-alanine--D-glutamate ligase, partial [Bacteroidales bacterium]